ncbi:MAG: TonB-dependent receptor, partial [Bacteroidetes bacterium]|nr:TonB-dependent receptor [Bacteroidota bacterium]
MKILICYITLLLFSTHLMGLHSDAILLGGIDGQVVDAKTNQPMAYVNIIVTDATENIVSSGITSEEGLFNIEDLPKGDFTISIQFIGYKTHRQNISLDKNKTKLNLGVIKLEEEATALDEVTVVAETTTIQQKVDRKVITIGKDLAASGSASDLMVAIPSVSVDPQSGEISLRGNSNVRVMVDGKLSNVPTTQLLKQIPSNAIKSIEIITNPSAKYSPEGMSGLLNIVLHKNTMIGFNGNVNLGFSYEKKPKFNSGLDLNYRNGKVNLYGSYSNNLAKNINQGFINRPLNQSNQSFEFENGVENHLYKIGLDYYINDRHTLSVFTSQTQSRPGFLGESVLVYQNNASFNQTQIWDMNEKNATQQYNLDYKIDINEEGDNIELEIDYNSFNLNNDVIFTYPVGASIDYIDYNETDRKRTTINLDYVNRIGDHSKLELGIQANLFNSLIQYASTGQSYNNQGTLEPTPETDFDYSRDILALYGNYNKKIDKWSYQIGLRIEDAKVDATALLKRIPTNATEKIPFTNHYFELYPSGFLTYSPSEKHSYQLNYSRRVDRPGIGQVNPIKEWSSPLISSFGNINLEPQFTNSVELNYTRNLKKGSLTFGTFYRLINNEINRALYVDRTDVQSGRLILTHDNFDKTSAVGVEISSNYKPTKWWSLNGSFDLFSQELTGITEYLKTEIENATLDDIVTDYDKVDNLGWNFRVFNSFKVNEKITLTAFGFYRGQNKTLQFDINPMYFVNVGSRYSFASNKGTLSLNFNDVFNTMKFGFEGAKPFPQNGAFEWESRT